MAGLPAAADAPAQHLRIAALSAQHAGEMAKLDELEQQIVEEDEIDVLLDDDEVAEDEPAADEPADEPAADEPVEVQPEDAQPVEGDAGEDDQASADAAAENPPPQKRAKLHRGGRGGSRRDHMMTVKRALLKELDKATREVMGPCETWTQTNTRAVMRRVREAAVNMRGAPVIHNRAQLERYRALEQKLTPQEQKSRKKQRVARTVHSRAYTVLDAALLSFFRGARKQLVRISRETLRLQAIELLRDDSISQACGGARSVSESYVTRFMNRHRLRTRCVQRNTSLTEEALAQRCQKFHEHVSRVAPLADFILNADEIPASTSGLLGNLKTVDFAANTDVKVNQNPIDLRRCATVLAFGGVRRVAAGEGEDGTDWVSLYVPPLVLLKGDPGMRIRAEQHEGDAEVVWADKGYMTSSIMCGAVLDHIKRYVKIADDQLCVLLLDAARSHLASPVAQAYLASRISISVIPASTTCWLQYVDVALGHAYRCAHYAAYEKREPPSSARERRACLVACVAQGVRQATKNVVRHFRVLGYLNPADDAVKIRGVEQYRYVPVPLTEADQCEDKVTLEEKIEAAKAKGLELVPSSTVKQNKRGPGRPSKASSLQPIKGVDIRKFFKSA